MKLVTFSFDDGTVQDRRLVALLNKYGMKATFNLCSSEWGQVHTIDHLGITVDHSELPETEIAQLYKDHEVACHTKTHPSNLDELSDEAILTRDYAAGLMSQEKANQKERLKIPMERIRKYFPKYYTTAQMEEEIVRMCEARFRSHTDRDAR